MTIHTFHPGGLRETRHQLGRVTAHRIEGPELSVYARVATLESEYARQGTVFALKHAVLHEGHVRMVVQCFADPCANLSNPGTSASL